MSARGFAPAGVAVSGVATPFAYWGFRTVCCVVDAITGSALHLHVSGLEQLREGFARRDGGSVVVTSDFPDVDLGQFVKDSGLPLIVFSDETGSFLDWTVSSRAMDVAGAARFCSRTMSALAPLLLAERALLIAPHNQTPRAVVSAIVEFLWPGRGEWLAERTFDHLVKVGDIDPDRADGTEGGGSGGSNDDLARAARESLVSYAPLMAGRWPDEIVWPLDLFLRPDNRPWRDPIDLTGPARAVLFGPYMHLPVGDWTARVEFEIDGAVSGVEAVTDVRMNEVVTEKTFAMPAKGIYGYELSFRVADPHHAVEIRLFMKKGAIEGVFLPRSVKVRPQRPKEG
jgi:hypothetical protein